MLHSSPFSPLFSLLAPGGTARGRAWARAPSKQSPRAERATGRVGGRMCVSPARGRPTRGGKTDHRRGGGGGLGGREECGLTNQSAFLLLGWLSRFILLYFTYLFILKDRFARLYKQGKLPPGVENDDDLCNVSATPPHPRRFSEGKFLTRVTPPFPPSPPIFKSLSQKTERRTLIGWMRNYTVQ